MYDDRDFEVDDVIDGRYRVLALLGRGGMGKVLRCYDEMLDKEVAMKLMLDLDASIYAARFQKEAQTTARLSHPNIVRVMDFGQTGNGELFLVMDLLEGRSLQDLLEDKGSLSVDETLGLAGQIASALGHAHRNGVLHRDIKPSNIMLVRGDTGKDQVKVVDFGLARFVGDDERLTGTGVGLGSPPYVSPEQGDGKEIDERADIYSFGCLLFAMLTGQPPFLADNPLATVLMHIKKPPPTLAQIKGSEFPRPVEELVARCLEKSPAKRPRSFEVLEEEINSLADSLRYGTHNLELDANFDPTRKKKLSVKNFSLMAGSSLLVLGTGIMFLIDQSLFSGDMTRKIFHLPERQVELTERQKLAVMTQGVDIGADTTRALEDKKLTPTIDYKPQFRMYTLTGEWTDKKLLELSPEDKAKFEILQIRKQNIDGSGFAALEDTAVRHLDLSDSAVQDPSMRHLIKMKQLAELVLNKCTNLTDEAVKILMHSPFLVSLHLSYTKITDKAVDYIGEAGKLITLNLTGCQGITGKNIGVLGKLEHPRALTILILDRTAFEPRFTGELARIKGLRTLHLASLGLSDADVEHLKHLSLTDLNLSGNEKLTERCLRSLREIKTLTRIDLRDCPAITSEALAKFRSESGGTPEVLY